jgi:hypothetical protein
MPSSSRACAPSIQAIASDSAGNIYVAGTTNASDFPVKNAAQPRFGESRILWTTDLGITWTRVGSPPADVAVVVPDPVDSQVLFSCREAKMEIPTERDVTKPGMPEGNAGLSVAVPQ